jgi:hypothetical protein
VLFARQLAWDETGDAKLSNRRSMSQTAEPSSERDELTFLAKLSHELTICARETYEPGTNNVLEPQLLRSYNELLHRITAAILERLIRTPTFPLQAILEMIESFGERNNRSKLMLSVRVRAERTGRE